MRLKILALMIVCFFSILQQSYSQSSQSFQLKKWSMSNAAANLSSSGLKLKESTLGGFAIGMSSSNSFVLNGGMVITFVDDTSMISSKIPNLFKLMQNYPNPFNPITTIQYTLPKKSDVTIKIYNSMGQIIKTMDQGTQNSGSYRLRWDAKNEQGHIVPSGVYYYQISATHLLPGVISRCRWKSNRRQ